MFILIGGMPKRKTVSRRKTRYSRRRGGAAPPMRHHFAFTVIPRNAEEGAPAPTLENYGNAYLRHYRALWSDAFLAPTGIRDPELSLIDIDIGIEEQVIVKAILVSYIRTPDFEDMHISALVTFDNPYCRRPIKYRDEDFCLFAYPVSDEDLERYMRQQQRRQRR
jgi:hypothetical protein